MSYDMNLVVQYDARKKSKGVGYVLWFFLGGLGAHRFYVGYWQTAIVLILCTFLTPVLTASLVQTGSGVAWLPYVLWLGWLLADVFRLGGWISDHNARLVTSLQRHEL